jgi:hypothetical protein
MGKSSKASKGGASAAASAALLTPAGDLSPGFTGVLRALFRRFDAGGDGVLDDGELNAFAAACNGGEPFSPDELEEVKARTRTRACAPSADACPFAPTFLLARSPARAHTHTHTHAHVRA